MSVGVYPDTHTHTERERERERVPLSYTCCNYHYRALQNDLFINKLYLLMTQLRPRQIYKIATQPFFYNTHNMILT